MPEFFLAGLLSSLCVSLLLVLTKHWHGRFSLDHTTGVQKFHTKPTPRIGGVGVAAGLLAAWAFVPPDANALLQPLLLASIPAFAAGLLEDVTKKVGVSARLLATMLSGGLACWITGISLHRVDIPLADTLLAWAPAAIIFTSFAVAGVANAINIIDGFNGLSSGTVLIILVALGTMAGLQGDAALAMCCVTLAAAVGGFWLVNFPLGKIFLGDGGAYLTGFALAWLSVLLLARHPSVSPWVVLLACAYPVTEVLYSMWRRRRQRQPTGAPDNQHLHSLIKTQIILQWVPHWPPRFRNAAVSPLMWIYAVLPAGMAIVLENAPFWAAVTALAAYVMLYHLSYQHLAKQAQRQLVQDSDKTLLSRPQAATGHKPRH